MDLLPFITLVDKEGQGRVGMLQKKKLPLFSDIFQVQEMAEAEAEKTTEPVITFDRVGTFA
jgi:hypothetical protein